MNFDQAFDRLLANEGVLSLNERDRGNWTSGIIGVGELKGSKYGVSAMSYPDLDIANLTIEDSKKIYRRDFWDCGHMDEYDHTLAFQVFDFAVNSGVETALRKLQRAAGVADDGFIGPVTIEAIQRRRPAVMILLFLAERLDYMRKLSSWRTQGAGWAARIADDMRYAVQDLESGS